MRGHGGGGGNAVNNMLTKGIKGVEFIAVNTDAQALQANGAPLKIQIGRDLTKGLGACARPTVGADAAMENHREIETALQGCDMVFSASGVSRSSSLLAYCLAAWSAARWCQL